MKVFIESYALTYRNYRFKSNSDLNMQNRAPSQSPIHDFVKHRKISGRTLKGKHKTKTKKKKNPFMKSLNDYVEVRRRIRFKNVNINDVGALRNSCGNPMQELDDSSVSDQDDSSFDSVKGLKPPSAIQIGRLEDKEISDARQIYQKEKSNKRRDESEPFDNFLKNCRIKKLVPNPMKIVNPSKEMNEVIKLNDYIIGDQYANVFATAFKKANQKIIHLNMRNNKLTNQGAIDIINNLTDHIVSIDFSLNKEMGPPAYELLGQQANVTFFRLKKLSLDHCNISKRSLQ